MKRIEAGLTDETGAAAILPMAGAALQAMESYNSRTTRFIQQQGLELRR